MKTIRIREGTVLYRVEAKEKRKMDNPKFYSYYRDGHTCDKKLWTNRCTDYCRYLEVRAKRSLKMIVVPYKTVLYLDPTPEDFVFAKTLIRLANRVYKGDVKKINCDKESVKELITFGGRDYSKCSSLLPDWVLAELICKAGFDGMVRFVEGDTINCYDEVAICSPDEKVEIIAEEMVKKRN